ASDFFRTPPPNNPLVVETIAFSTFDLILAPLVSNQPSNITNLFISADGLLTSLPFSALCTSLPKDNNYKSWPFLIKEFNISYLPYVSYLKQYKGQTLDFKHLACFAPLYNPLPNQQIAQQSLPQDLVRSEYYQLPGAQAEVKQINSLFPQSKLFAGKAFPKEAFIKQAPKYDLLHLAMHAVTNYQNPIESKLIFSSNSGQVSVLSMEALLDLNLKTQHIVLSACYTGVGNYEEGEGQISIAYAFQQLDIPTIISNSWAAPDQSASRINTGYYQGLKRGEPAPLALKNAQIAYLETDGPVLMGHPYYWAGIQIQGDTSTSFKATSRWSWLIILGIIGLGLFYYLLRRSNKSEALLA
ncbi:MAG: CHAT domain-containing protein, partial [Bacteroidota bacterium]